MLDPGDKIVDCPPTFTMYEFDAAVNGALVIKGKNNIFNLYYYSFRPLSSPWICYQISDFCYYAMSNVHNFCALFKL